MATLRRTIASKTRATETSVSKPTILMRVMPELAQDGDSMKTDCFKEFSVGVDFKTNDTQSYYSHQSWFLK